MGTRNLISRESREPGDWKTRCLVFHFLFFFPSLVFEEVLFLLASRSFWSYSTRSWNLRFSRVVVVVVVPPKQQQYHDAVLLFTCEQQRQLSFLKTTHSLFSAHFLLYYCPLIVLACYLNALLVSVVMGVRYGH